MVTIDEPPSTARSSEARRRRPALPAVIWAGIVLGVAIRIAVVVRPPTQAMLWDHHEYVRWGVQMLEGGLLDVHTVPPPETLLWNPMEQKAAVATHEEQFTCNYPPLAVYLLYVQGHVLRALDPDMVSNTVTARLVYSTPSMICDLLIAAGCYAIVRMHAGRRSAAAAFVVAVLAPPFIIDSAHWGQTDAWVLAPLTWMVWLMMKQRWLTAGLLWGAALSIKPQAMLMAPVWIVALLLRPGPRPMMGALVAPAVLAALGLPFSVGGGRAWFQRSYLDNLLHSYPDTTLKAFNIWYVDLLLCESDDAERVIFGLTKDLWGKILFGGSLLGVIIHAVRRRFDDGRSLLTLAAAILLLSVILPTRVHERYILMPVPFLIAAAGLNRRLWWPVVPLIVAASFQMTVLDWLHTGADGWRYVEEKIHREYEQLKETLPADELEQYPPPEEMLRSIRPRFLEQRWRYNAPLKEWSLTILELLSAAGCIALLVRGEPPKLPAADCEAPKVNDGRAVT